MRNDQPDPERLVRALQDAGFTLAFRKEGQYVRLAWPPATAGSSLIVPLDRDAPDFEELWNGTRRWLATYARVGHDLHREVFATGVLDIDDA